METVSRVRLIALAALLACAIPAGLQASGAGLPSPEPCTKKNVPAWPGAPERQRRADQGDGTFINPVMSGDHADPSVLKDGQDYYMVHSSFVSTPGLLVWHSRDLVNWQPIGPALRQPVGSVWAPDLCKHNGRYYIYFPALGNNKLTNMVVWADSPSGPWSDPIDLKIGNIDPGHAVDAEGRRWLFMSAGFRVPLAADGLSVSGPEEKVYDGWQFPKEWDVETFAQEGPKVMKRGEYYYMILAEGGTAGPATSHMVIMARSRNLKGPWENSPFNPVVRTRSAQETWWSRGHATLVEGPDGKQWYLVYHAYEKGHYNLGRQTILEPVEWTADGWVRAMGDDISRAVSMPAEGTAVPHGIAFSDDFSTDMIGTRWALFNAPGPVEQSVKVVDRSLVLQARGSTPKDGNPLTLITGDHNYEIQVEAECDEGATAGLLLFYSERLFAGLGISEKEVMEYGKGDTQGFPKPAHVGRRFFLRLRLDHDVMTTWYSVDGKDWTRHWMQFEVSGYHHNVAGGFLSMRPALYAGGKGEVRFRDFRYRALP